MDWNKLFYFLFLLEFQFVKITIQYTLADILCDTGNWSLIASITESNKFGVFNNIKASKATISTIMKCIGKNKSTGYFFMVIGCPPDIKQKFYAEFTMNLKKIKNNSIELDTSYVNHVNLVEGCSLYDNFLEMIFINNETWALIEWDGKEEKTFKSIHLFNRNFSLKTADIKISIVQFNTYMKQKLRFDLKSPLNSTECNDWPSICSKEKNTLKIKKPVVNKYKLAAVFITVFGVVGLVIMIGILINCNLTSIKNKVGSSIVQPKETPTLMVTFH